VLPLIKYETYIWIMGVKPPAYTYEKTYVEMLEEVENYDWLVVADIVAAACNLFSYLASVIGFASSTYNLIWT